MKIALHLYYKEIKVRKSHVLHHDGPMIIIANHPNTLVDALLLGVITPKPVYFMAKATYFNSKFKMKLLRMINMIPINRATEEKTDGVNNDSVFEECYRLLAEGKTLVIFPEGNSQMEWSLRKLKSGTARIALETQLRNDGKLNLKIIPAGLMYTQGEKFRSSILVDFGEGIFVNQHLELYKSNKSLAAKKLTDEFKELLEGVLVATENKEQEEFVFMLTKHLQSKYLQNADSVVAELNLIKDVRDAVNRLKIEDSRKLDEIQQIAWSLEWKAEKLSIREDFLDRGLRSSLFIRQIFTSFIALVIGFPIFILGLIPNIIPYFLTDLILRKFIRISREFYAPLSILISLVLYPINYAIWAVLFCKLINPPCYVIIGVVVSLPFLGFIAYHFYNYLKHISYKIKYTFLLMNNKSVIIEMKEQRKSLFRLLFDK